MKIDKKIAELVCALEYTIGNQTYNPNSYNGWTGEEGCGFKYPVNYCADESALENRTLSKTKSRIEYIDADCIKTMKYAFGSNHLYIGNGIIEALKFLEDRYDIDFNELEEIRTQKRISKMEEYVSTFEKGNSITIPMGRWEVGMDIPEGNYLISNISENISHYIMIYVYDQKGNHLEHIFTKEEQIQVQLKNGWILKLYDPYIFERKVK